MMLLNMELERDVHNRLQYITGHNTENGFTSQMPQRQTIWKHSTLEDKDEAWGQKQDWFSCLWSGQVSKPFQPGKAR